MMVTDHSKAGEELKQVASRSNIDVPAEMDEKHRDLSERLSKLTGAEFDREYMSAMVTGHQEVVEKLERQSRMSGNSPATTGENTTGTAVQEGAARGDASAPHGDASAPRGDASTQGDAAITQWASKTLPTAQKHLERARQIQKQIGG
jgi:predicted outer membrane protein